MGGLDTARCQRPPDLVQAVRADRSGGGGPTPRQVANRTKWERIAPGLYVPAVRSDSVEQRILEQSARLPADAAVTGWAALRWRGAAYFDGTGIAGEPLPVPLLLGGDNNLRPHPGSALSWEQLGPTECELVDGIWLTTVQRAIFDEMRRVDSRLHRVVTIEMAVAARLTTVALQNAYVARRPAWTGVPAVREAMTLAIDHSRSPRETRMRLVWVGCGFPPPMCNQPVYDLDGRLVGVPDLFDPEAGLVGEYDGAHHKRRDQHRQDVAREQRFRNVGLEYFTVVAGDATHVVRERMEQARLRSRFLAPESRAWTVTSAPVGDAARDPGRLLRAHGSGRAPHAHLIHPG